MNNLIDEIFEKRVEKSIGYAPIWARSIAKWGRQSESDAKDYKQRLESLGAEIDLK